VIVRRALTVIVTIGAIVCATGIGAAAPGPEHARLTALCGIWNVEMTLWPRPDGAGIAAKATSIIRRTVIQAASADAMVATSYLSFGNVPEWKAVEIKYARRAGL
jgi:hypothetical protein